MEDFLRPAAPAMVFAQAVQAALGIYRHRWGDAIIRRIMLALMGSRVLYLDEVAPLTRYCHRKFCAPGETKSDGTPFSLAAG